MLRACLAVVLLTCVVSPALAQNGRGDMSVPGTNDTANRNASTGTGTATPQDKPAAAGNYVRPATPAASQGGGGGDEDAVMRMRVPKWNSFLPGMFR